MLRRDCVIIKVSYDLITTLTYVLVENNVPVFFNIHGYKKNILINFDIPIQYLRFILYFILYFFLLQILLSYLSCTIFNNTLILECNMIRLITYLYDI